ncbi:unnamed protein product [Candidula unifasciata]|uniref:C1q domain-containing protein n=1 Tax=Candidula unifasciata TaxID=100452 RepID=A0A8S3Z575_9EUPU|nr:unnamed protein product [Candidula unifasciata]
MALAQVEAGQIAFSVAFREETTLLADKVVKYSHIYTNHGGAYSKAAGIFRVPRNGMYVFNLHGKTQSGKELHLDLYHNDKYLISAFTRDSSQSQSGANSVVLRLIKGDEIYVKTRGAASVFGRPETTYVVFNGFILGLLSIPDEYRD